MGNERGVETFDLSQKLTTWALTSQNFKQPQLFRHPNDPAWKAKAAL